MTYKRLYTKAGSFIIVKSSKPLIIMVRNDEEQKRYISRGTANFYGGFFNHFPALIQVPETGYWNVSVETCGFTTEKMEYSVEIFQEGIYINPDVVNGISPLTHQKN